MSSISNDLNMFLTIATVNWTFNILIVVFFVTFLFIHSLFIQATDIGCSNLNVRNTKNDKTIKIYYTFYMIKLYKNDMDQNR